MKTEFTFQRTGETPQGSSVHFGARYTSSSSSQSNTGREGPRTRRRLAPLCCIGLLVAGALLADSARAATNDLTTTLQKGLFEEEANHNLGAAIQLYQSVVNQFDKDRKLAATAVFRLAECYRKQGNTNEANAQYERVLREFADQTQLTTLSRQNLAVLGGTPAVVSPAVASAARQEQKKLLEQEIDLVKEKLETQKKQIEVGRASPEDLIPTQRQILELKRQIVALEAGGSLASTGTDALSQQAADAKAEAAVLQRRQAELKGMSVGERRIAVQQEYPNPVLTSLMQKLADSEQNLAALNKAFGPNNPKVIEENERLKTVTSQVDAQVKAVLAGLEARQKEADARATSLAQAAIATSPAEASTAQPSTSAEAEEVRRIQAMIKDSPDLINAKPDQGLAPLSSAASKGQLAVAQFLLEHGADVEVKDPMNQRTPLDYAAYYGHKAIVELLLDHRAQVNAKDNNGKTALHLAAEKGFRSVVEVLLEHGADINAVDHGGASALHFAVGNGFRAVTELLLAKGADPNVSAADARVAGRNLSGAPLHLAVDRGDSGLVELLLANKAKPNTTDNQGRTPLDLAASSFGRTAVAEVLLSHAADVNATNDDPNQRGWTPLVYAVAANQKEMVDLLLKHQADPNASIESGSISSPAVLNPRDMPGYTPLLIACTQGHGDIVGSLLEAKADPNMKSANGSTAVVNTLTRVPLPERVHILSMLLDHGASPDLRGSDGKTPLMMAADMADKESLELLLSHKADAKAKYPKYDMTALHWLFMGNRRNWPKDIPQMAQDLIAAGADVNAQDYQGKTPLNYIARFTPPRGLQLDPVLVQAREVLRKAGAVEDLARMDVIQIGRPSANTSTVVFGKGTNDYNHFTLFELLGAHYGFISANTRGTTQQDFDGLSRTAKGALQFPDLAHVVIRRPKPDRTEWTTTSMNLSGAFKSDAATGQCSGDEPLQWGDVVEIPEADHPISAGWQGLPEKEVAVLEKCLTRQVQITVKGSTTNMVLKPLVHPVPGLNAVYAGGAPGFAPRIASFKDQVPSFMLVPVLYRSGLLRASSDLSRVKVSRRDPSTGQRYEMVFDCSPDLPPDKVPDLWLRNGDQIEVPERSVP